MTDATVGDHITSEVDGNRAVIRIGARLDALEAHALRAIVDDMLVNGLQHLLIDLTRTEFVDSAGLASLIRAMTVLKQRDGQIKLIRPESEAAWRVFRLTKFDEVFTFHTVPPVTEAKAP
jgi:stage II sporulation protein AA (anti-sigma F factor antagonist)